MTVDELLDKLGRAFPAFNARALETWAPIYRTTLGRHEGPALKSAFTEVLSTFQPAKAKTLYPMVSDFVAHLPAGHPKVPGGPALDIKGQRSRLNSLMSIWRAGQGRRGSNGVPEVLQALEFIAHPIAEAAAWGDNPEPVLLTKTQLKQAQQRAISQQRRVRYGSPGNDPDAWWQQISAIAHEWRIAVTRDEWTKDSPEAQAA